MPAWRSAVDDWLRTHHGVIGADGLEQCGMSLRTAERWVADRRFERLMPGVFKSAQWPESLEQWCVAACARNSAAMIGLTTAGALWKHRGVRNRGLHTLLPHGRAPELPGMIVHRCRQIDPVDVVERPDGIRLTSPPRTVFDSADMLGFEGTRSVLEQVLREEQCTFGTMCDTLSRLYHPNRPGSRTMLEVIRSKPSWQRALQSELEVRVLMEIERQGLPSPVTQCPVMLPGGLPIHLDFGWPTWKVGLEVDDPTWHDGAAESQRDARRDRKATSVGWAIARVTRLDVEGDLRDAVHDVGVIIGGRAA